LPRIFFFFNLGLFDNGDICRLVLLTRGGLALSGLLSFTPGPKEVGYGYEGYEQDGGEGAGGHGWLLLVNPNRETLLLP